MCRNSELTGYEIAKETGISRSNVYTALKSLVDKGAANIVEEKSTKYIAVPIEEFCNNKIQKLKDLKDDIAGKMPEKNTITDGYITVTGDENILNKMRYMLSSAKEIVYMSMSSEYVMMLVEDINKAIDNKLKVVIVTDKIVSIDSAKIYYSQKRQNQIRLITDSENVLTGEFSKTNNSKNSSCLYSNKKNLVVLFKEALQNEIKLIELKEEL